MVGRGRKLTPHAAAGDGGRAMKSTALVESPRPTPAFPSGRMAVVVAVAVAVRKPMFPGASPAATAAFKASLAIAAKWAAMVGDN